MSYCVALLVLAAMCQFRVTTALTSGAPVAACTTLTQQHLGAFLQMCTDCPFRVRLVAIDGEATNGTQYRCGSQHTCKSQLWHTLFTSVILLTLLYF